VKNRVEPLLVDRELTYHAPPMRPRAKSIPAPVHIPASGRAARRRNPRRPLAALLGALLLAIAPVAALAAHGPRPAHRKRAAHTHSRRPARHRKSPAPRGHALKMIWGPLNMPDGASAFPVYHRLGVQVLELQLSWAATAATRPANPSDPADPAYNWPAALDQATAEAARYGISLAVMVKETPAWANGGQDPSWAPNEPSDYAAFMQAASRRYPSIHYWMIWGEVTRPGNFNPMPANSPVGPERYAALLDAAYGALKAVNSANLVIGGMTYTVGLVSPADYLKWLRLPDGAPPRMDFYGENPYSTRFPDLSENPYSPDVRDINDIDTLDQELTRDYAGHGPTPKLWLSEFSISSDAPSRAFDFFVTRPIQAKWVTAAFKLVDSVPYVAGLGWYELLDESSSIPEHLTEGLMTADGQPKPSFYAYARAP
jgi:hypothetical protein